MTKDEVKQKLSEIDLEIAYCKGEDKWAELCLLRSHYRDELEELEWLENAN
jgi:hypothetical protein